MAEHNVVKRCEHLTALYQNLGAVAHISLRTEVINRFLHDHFADWEYRAERIGPQPVSFLQRMISKPLAEVPIPEPQAPRQSIYQSDYHLAIIIDDEVRGCDLRYVIQVEGCYRAWEQAQEAKINHPLAKAFQEATDTYSTETDPFTAKQAIILSLTTHCNNRNELAQTLGLPPTSSLVVRLLDAARERVNVTSRKFEAYIELTQIAIALGIAGTDHLPEGRTERLGEDEKKLLRGYYSPLPEQRAEVRAWMATMPLNTRVSKWARLYPKLGPDVKNRHAAILLAIKDGLLAVPDPTTIQERVTRYLEGERSIRPHN